MHCQFFLSVLLSASAAFACDSCYGPTNFDIHTRHVRRQQPEALNATTGPRGPLEWGQINFLHTTDTHSWLAGHLKEQNYGADWGDFVSFTRHMKRKAQELGVDLLIVDSGKRFNKQTTTDSLVDSIPQVICMMETVSRTQPLLMESSLMKYSRSWTTIFWLSATMSYM